MCVNVRDLTAFLLLILDDVATVVDAEVDGWAKLASLLVSQHQPHCRVAWV